MILDSDFDVRQALPRPRTAPRASPIRILAIAASLCLHLSGLAWLLLRAVDPMPRVSRPASSAPAGLQLVLIETEPPQPAAVPAVAASPSRTAVLSQAPPARWRVAPAAPVPADPKPPTPPTADAADLFDSIAAAARAQVRTDALAPRQRPQPALPGRGEAIIALPVRFRQRPSPEQVVAAIRDFLAAGSAMASDRIGDVRDRNDPLVRWTEQRMRDAVDPVCNDPENPRIDARCLE